MSNVIRTISTEKLSVRDNTEEPVIYGYFAVYNNRTQLWGDVYEQIAPGAFDKALLNNDVRCLYNHDTGVVLGRMSAGTLTLRSDAHGLYGEVRINTEDKQAMDIYARVKRGDISGCSFGFCPIDEPYEYIDGKEVFTLREADLSEVSVCVFPAYEDTDIKARSKLSEADKTARVMRLKSKLEVIRNGNKNTDR